MTYKAKLWTYDEAKQEVDYLQSIDPLAPGSTFNNDPAIFARYANMQANHLMASGFRILAHDSAQCRDIAVPTFRSDARAAGRYIRDGIFVADSYDQWADICSAKPAA